MTRAQHYQELIGEDPLARYGLFERVRRTTTSAASLQPSLFFASPLNNTLQSGHTWANAHTGAGTVNLAYTVDAFFGSASGGTPQCIQLVSGGDASGTGKTSLTRQTAINMTNLILRLWLKIDPSNAANLHQILVYLGGGASAFQNFQVAAPLKDPGSSDTQSHFRPGEWFPLTLTPASFSGNNWAGGLNTGTLDWTTIQDFQIAVNDNGSSLPVTVYFGGLEFLPADSANPHGVVSFTFDDLYASQYTAGFPYLAKYGYRATVYAIGDAVGAAGYMSQAQLDQLARTGHEVAAHAATLAFHNTAGGITGVTLAQLINDWSSLKYWLHQHAYSGFEQYATPQGRWDLASLATLAQQFSAHRTTNDLTIETMPPGDPLRLRCVPLGYTPGLNSQRTYGANTSVGSIKWLIDQVYAYGGWLIFLVHDIQPSPSGSDNKQVSSTNFQSVVDYVATRGVPVRTVGDVLGL